MDLDKLRKLAGSPDMEDRIRALGWLEQCNDTDAMELIKQATYDSEPGVRFLARKALKKLSKQLNVDVSEVKVDNKAFLGQVFSELESGDEKQKIAASRKIRKLPHLGDLHLLYHCLEKEENPPVIVSLLKTVSGFSPPRDHRWLQRFMFFQDQSVQVQAVKTAEVLYPGSFMDYYRTMLDSGNLILIMETAPLLAATERIKVFDVIKGLLKDASPAVRLQGVDILGRIATMEARNLLTKMLNDRDMDVRIRVSMVVAEVDLKIARELEEEIPAPPEEGEELSKKRLKEILKDQRQTMTEKVKKQRANAKRAMAAAAAVSVIPPSKRGNLEFWKEKITYPDYQVRLQAVQEAGVASMAPLLPFLLTRLKEEDSKYVLASLVKVVASLGGSRVVDDIKPFLRHDDGRVRANTVEALGSIGIKDVFDLLLPLLNDEVGRVKANTVQVLWSFSQKKVIQKLEKMVESPEIWERSSAIYTLERIPVPRVLPLVKKLLRDSNTEIKVRAAELFSKIESGSGGEPGELTVAGFLDEFDEVETELMNMTHQDYRRRVNAALTLHDIGPASITPRLSNLLKLEKNEYVIATLVKTLGKLGGETVVEALRPFLDHPDSRVRANTVEAIDLTRSQLRFSLLGPYIRDPDDRVRANAVKSLWKISPGNTRKLLEAMIGSAKLSDRLFAVKCLEVVRTPDALARLEKLTEHQAREVADAARESLEKAQNETSLVPMGEADALTLQVAEEVAGESAEVLKTGSDWDKLKQVISENIEKLGSAKPTEVFGAQSILQELVDEATLPYVEEILDTENNPAIVLSLLKFVEIREGEKAVYKAVPYLKDRRPDMQRKARDIVLKHDKLEINTLLINDLWSGIRKIEEQAIKALWFIFTSRIKEMIGLRR